MDNHLIMDSILVFIIIILLILNLIQSRKRKCNCKSEEEILLKKEAEDLMKGFKD